MTKFLSLKLLFIFILVPFTPTAFSFDLNSPVTIYIDSFKQPCPENTNTYCLRFRENQNSQWLPLTVPIEGFDHQEGTNYELLVYEDIPNRKLVLIEIVNQEVIPILKPQENTNLEEEAKIKDAQATSNISDEIVTEKSTDNTTNPDNSEVTDKTPTVSVLSDAGFVLTGAQWQLNNIGVEGRLVTPTKKSNYTLNLRADGSLAVVADCYTGLGNYAFNSEWINFNINYGDDCEAESLATVYREGLEQTSSYIIQDDKLHLLYSGSNLMTFTAVPIPETPVEGDNSSSPNLEPTLENNLWLLRSIDKGDQVQDVQGRYSIKLSEDGSLKVDTDCYQGEGTYSLEGNYISFEFPIEHKTCTPEPFVTEEFAQGLMDVEAYSLQGNKLYIRIASSGDVMVFTQADEVEVNTATPKPPIKKDKFKAVKIEALAIRSSVPTDWPIVNRHPFFNNIWAKGPFNYISFEAAEGDSDFSIVGPRSRDTFYCTS